jgi:hypothetical protein
MWGNGRVDFLVPAVVSALEFDAFGGNLERQHMITGAQEQALMA